MSQHPGRIERMKATLLRESALLAEQAAQLNESISPAIDLLLATSGHVFVGGAGTSNAIARRFAHLLSCCGLPSSFIHPADSLHGGSGALKPGDTLVLISKGGRTLEINQFASIARKLGARLIAVTESPESELGQMADAIIKVKIPPDSDPFGMVATSSSLTNSAVLDAICETVLVEKGYTLESFARTHPGGAVGKKIQDQGLS